MNHMFDMIEGTQVATKAPQKWLPCPICPTQCPNWPNCNVTKAITLEIYGMPCPFL